MYNNPYMYGGAGAGMNFGTNPYYNPYMQNQMFQQQAQAQQQPQPQPQQQPVSQAELPIQAIKFVTADEAKAYIVMANQKVLLIDKANGMAYVKSADSVGQSKTDVFKFSQANTQETQKEANLTPSTQPEYVVKDDLKGFITNDKLDEVVKGLKSEFNKGLTDLKKSQMKKILDEGV